MTEWEQDYIAIRKKEGFFFTDEEVKELPLRPKDDINYSKWQMRKNSTDRLLNYLRNPLSDVDSILDLGCGNGWFSNKLANLNSVTLVEAWDVNKTELDQAQRVFQRENLNFRFQDIFDEKIIQRFDIIILNSVIQYFPDVNRLLDRLLSRLNPSGEIHILDSPFYQAAEIIQARSRSQEYYGKLGFPHMAKHYFHHNAASIAAYDHEILFQPNKLLNRVKRKLGAVHSPFMWLKIHHQTEVASDD